MIQVDPVDLSDNRLSRRQGPIRFVLLTAITTAVILYGSLYPFEFRIPAAGGDPLSTLFHTWRATPGRGDGAAGRLREVKEAIDATDEEWKVIGPKLLNTPLCSRSRSSSTARESCGGAGRNSGIFILQFHPPIDLYHAPKRLRPMHKIFA